jgi:hypothetical protein
MFTAVISFNISLAILCLIAVWKLHQTKRALRRATRWLIHAEQNTHRILSPAPYYILRQSSAALRQRQMAEGLWSMQQQIIRFGALLKLLQWIHQRQTQPTQRRFSASASAKRLSERLTHTIES